MYKSVGREIGIILFKAVTIVCTIFIIFAGLGFFYEFEESIGDGGCNIAVFPVEGVILPYNGLVDVPLITTPESLEDFLLIAEDQPNIEGVLLEINSPGGTPVASERIAERLRASTLPVVGLIGDQGASGGYMVAAATDYLIGSAMSDVGSIGVNMSYVEESIKNEEEGLTYVQLTTGAFKDTGSINRPITDEERERLEQDLDVIHNHFIDLIARYRNLDREKVVALADGATMPGARAVDEGLMDQIGGRSEARTAFATLLATDESAVSFCEYEAPLLPF